MFFLQQPDVKSKGLEVNRLIPVQNKGYFHLDHVKAKKMGRQSFNKEMPLSSDSIRSLFIHKEETT